MNPRALIADDEALLRAELVDMLAAAWPELEIVATPGDGPAALAALIAHQPDVAFLDIRMPGFSGLEVAAQLGGLGKRPHVVFVTAYDAHALEAFEHQAADYLLKPLTPERLARTVTRLRALVSQAQPAPDLGALLQALQKQVAPATPPLRWIRAAVGDSVRLIAIDDVIYFAAADKYVAVFTREGESLIRTPLKELAEQLDPAVFQQIHRGTVVNLRHVQVASTDARGHLVLRLNGRPETLQVSRSYTHLFRQM